MRFNLDPSGMEHSDAQLWMALEKVGLKDWTIQLGGLDADLSGSLQGSNVVNGQASGDLTKGETCLSVGQRQLVCLVIRIFVGF